MALIAKSSSEWVTKNRRGLLEANGVLARIYFGFFLIPFKFHDSNTDRCFVISQPSLGVTFGWVTITALANPRAAAPC